MIPTLSDFSSAFARLVLKCIDREYPNKLDHCLDDATQVGTPRALHPAFFGCFDWHSAVHGHWLLVHLLRTCPSLPEAEEIRCALNKKLTAENILAEVEYFQSRNRASFERLYGWAWLLKLADELRNWDEDEVRQWSRNLRPLVEILIERYLGFLPRQTYPIRTGVHPNTAFGLSFALDYARTIQHQGLVDLIDERSRAYYLTDSDYPASWEPGGEDFLSPALIEADLMRRILTSADFREWFHGFLPGIAEGKPNNLLVPALVSDRTDGKLAHLDGLNLSRAWCMRNIAAALAQDDPAGGVLRKAACVHAEAGLANVMSGNYEGEHWLATFAVYMLSTPDPE